VIAGPYSVQKQRIGIGSSVTLFVALFDFHFLVSLFLSGESNKRTNITMGPVVYEPNLILN
jgi:hypothetical protein